MIIEKCVLGREKAREGSEKPFCQGVRHPQRPGASRHRRQEILGRIEFFPIKCRIQNAKDNFRLYQDDLVRGNGFWRSKPGQGPKIKVAPPSPPRRCLRHEWRRFLPSARQKSATRWRPVLPIMCAALSAFSANALRKRCRA